MLKRQNSLETSVIISALNYGEHGINKDNMLEEIRRMCDGAANGFIIRPNLQKLTDETYLELTKYARDKKMYFGVLYAYQFPPPGERSHFRKDLIEKIEEVAGEYFLGEFFGEAGSDKAAKARGYFVEGSDVLALQRPPQNFENMQQPKDFFVAFIKKMADFDRSIGLSKTAIVEATALFKYSLEGGIDMPVLEVMPGNPEILISFARGAAIGYKRKGWGGFIANEWYGGYRHEDALKIKRLRLCYNYLFMSGANLAVLESGNNELKSFGYNLSYDSKECGQYRDEIKRFYNLISTEKRPNCGPYCKVGFIHGNLDGYTNFMGSSIWSQFDKKEWGISSPEYSWKILDSVYRSRDWHDTANFAEGELDLSNSPAYGMYDVLPIESDLDVLLSYDMLIFAGWNTMTEELAKKLFEYAKAGGHLVICACHLNTSNKRDGEFIPVDGDIVEEMTGCRIAGEFETNDGVKFARNSLNPGVKYSGTKNFWCDCNYPGAYARYAKVERTTGRAVGFFADSFQAPADLEKVNPVLVENKCGEGMVSFFTCIDYPGHSGVFPIYQTVVKEYLTASHRNCELKVSASDKIRFSLFFDEDEGNKKLYLLNTDFNNEHIVTVIYKDKSTKVKLDSLELKGINLNDE